MLMAAMVVSASAQNYSIDWYVIASGGGHTESENYRLDGTIGQPLTGQSLSDSNGLQSGFWVMPGAITSANDYVPGDANMWVGQWPPLVIGSDVTFLVNYFRGTTHGCLVSGFYCSGDANGDCQVIGSDVTRMVTYFRGLAGISYCADYEPSWPTPENCPVDSPAGWPNCETEPITGEEENPLAKSGR